MPFIHCVNGQNDVVSQQREKERHIRLITLAEPFSNEHWMPCKRRGLTKDYTAQDILKIVAELKPHSLERFITGYQKADEMVPVREGHAPMTVLEFLNAAILAGAEGCHIIPKLNLQWLKSEKGAEYFWKSAQALYDMPLVNPIRNINLDVWDHYCNEIHKTQEQRDEMFQRLRDIGYEKIGINMTGLYNVNHPQIDYADFNIKKGTWEINEQAIKTLRSFPNIKRLFMYIDYPGAMNEFRKNAPDTQADVYCKTILPSQSNMNFTFVYAIIQDTWDANECVTSKDGAYGGKTIYQVIKELLYK